MRVYALLVLALFASSYAPAKEKERAWQEGVVVAIQRPGDPVPFYRKGTVGPEISSSRQGSGNIVVPEGSSFGAVWAIAIDLPDAGYVVTLSIPPRKSSISKLEPGSHVTCAAEGKTLYLRDDSDKQFRARIRQKSEAEPKQP